MKVEFDGQTGGGHRTPAELIEFGRILNATALEEPSAGAGDIDRLGGAVGALNGLAHGGSSIRP